MPGPIAAEVERGVQIDVSVLQFGEHIGHHLELLLRRHGRIELPGITAVYLLPVNTFLREEAVMLVHDTPQRLEVPLRIIGKFVIRNTSGNRTEQGKCGDRYFQNRMEQLSHGIILLMENLRTMPSTTRLLHACWRRPLTFACW